MEQKYIDRFHTKYRINNSTGCWEWANLLDRYGYGRITCNGISVKAHRFSAMIHGLDMSKPVVRHMCNNRCCVNPAHLATGTIQDNIDDRNSANRQAKGADQHLAKLTEHQVIEIRSKYIPRKYTLKRLAKEYNVNVSTIYAIIKDRSWKHLYQPAVPFPGCTL